MVKTNKTSVADLLFLGYFANEAAIIAAFPTASAGQYCVNTGTDTLWVYDVDTTAWIDSSLKSAVTSVFSRTGAVTAASNDYTWAQIDKTTSSIADITTKSHTALSDKGTNTHAQIDTAVSNSVSHLANTSNPHSVTQAQIRIAQTLTDAATTTFNTVLGAHGTIVFTDSRTLTCTNQVAGYIYTLKCTGGAGARTITAGAGVILPAARTTFTIPANDTVILSGVSDGTNWYTNDNYYD